MPEHSTGGEKAQRDGGGALPCPAAEKVDEAQREQHAGENEKGHGRSNRRDGHKGRQKGADDAANGVKRAECSNCFSTVVERVDRVFHERGRNGAQQKQRVDKDNHAGQKCREHEKICADRQNQKP